MRKTVIIVLFLTVSLVLTPFVFAQEKLWLDLTDQAITQYQQKKFDSAIQTARKALEVAEKTFGPEHANVAESLDNLAVYLQAENKFDEAERLYERALKIIEKSFGPESEYLGIFLNYLSNFYKKIGKPGVAKQMEDRAAQIRAKNNASKK